MTTATRSQNWFVRNVWHSLVLPLGDAVFYTEDESELAARLQVDLAKEKAIDGQSLSAFLLEEAREIDQRLYDAAASVEGRAMTLQGAVAIATTLTLAAGGLLLDRSKIPPGGWRDSFAGVILLTAVAFIASGLRALGASSRTHPWTNPGFNDIFDHAKGDVLAARATQSAAYLKSAGLNLRIVQLKAGYLNSAVYWFRLALCGLAIFAGLFLVYAVFGPTATASRSPAVGDTQGYRGCSDGAGQQRNRRGHGGRVCSECARCTLPIPCQVGLRPCDP